MRNLWKTLPVLLQRNSAHQTRAQKGKAENRRGKIDLQILWEAIPEDLEGQGAHGGRSPFSRGHGR
jgi:hypothetical protein